MNIAKTFKVTAAALAALYTLKVLGETEQERHRLELKLANTEARHRIVENTLIRTIRSLPREDAAQVRKDYREEMEFERITYHFNK